MENLTHLLSRLFSILIIVIASLFAYLIAIVLVKRFARVVSKERGGDPRIQRVASLFLTITRWALILFTLLIALYELDINVAPLLAGAGIAGIALSFAAQALLKDVGSGIGILVGNHFRQGDIIITNGIQGVVEHISLMKTTIRDRQTLYTIPNGQISIVGVIQTGHHGRKK